MKISDPGLLGSLVAVLAVALNSLTAIGTYASSGNQNTPSVTVTPSGGVAPYTYEWIDQGGGSTFTCNAPTSKTTNWSINATFPNGYTANWKCQVTDARGDTVLSQAVQVVMAP